MWKPEELSFELQDDLTDDPVLTIKVFTPDGAFRFMAEPAITDSILILRGLRIQDARANALGTANLMVLAHVVMERMGLDGIVVEGAARTSGANPVRRPGAVRFTRRGRPSSAAGPGGP
jgi:hypothetical protein